MKQQKRFPNYITQTKKQVEPIIENIGKHKNINIEIVDAKAKIIYSSIAKNQSGENLPNEITQVFNDNRLDIIKSYIYITVSNDKHEESSRTLVFMQTLSKDRFIVISKQLSGITESVIIMNQFALLSGSVIILVGGILTLIISSRATKPILEMSETAEKISNLDFDNSIDVQSEDEIGVLANSINSISNKLSRSIEDLKTDIERRKRLVRDISHELKTPIGVIKGYSEGIKFGVADSPEMMNKYMDTIVDECNRMDDMVKEMIELSSYEYAQKKLEVTQIGVSSLIDTISERFEPILREGQISFSTSASGVESFSGDFHLIARAVSNFMTNAVKYVDKNKRVGFNVYSDSESVYLSVYNSGNCIAEDELEKVWDIFYKIDETRTRTSKSGSGLGLSIVKQVANLHTGDAFAENVDDGVNFILKIPRNFT